ncbi:MAG: ribbon-helix-helix protein, CopG family [Chloroflexota bacterium]|nr:ribbon-helix-helix protein, CopG family [Chloroflexota bacterium]
MPDTEKITINIGSVDLGRVDLLVQEGFYSSRSDFIRTAIRNQLERQKTAVDSITTRKSMVIGTLSYTRSDLEKKREVNEMINVKVIGMFILADDVTPNLALDTIQSVTVRGVFKAPEDVKQALSERLH